MKCLRCMNFSSLVTIPSTAKLSMNPFQLFYTGECQTTHNKFSLDGSAELSWFRNRDSARTISLSRLWGRGERVLESHSGCYHMVHNGCGHDRSVAVISSFSLSPVHLWIWGPRRLVRVVSGQARALFYRPLQLYFLVPSINDPWRWDYNLVVDGSLKYIERFKVRINDKDRWYFLNSTRLWL